MTTDLDAKRLQLLKEAMPRLKKVAVLFNPATNWHARVIEDLKAVASSLSIELAVVASERLAISMAFADFARSHVQALYLSDDALFFSRRNRL